MGCQSGVEDGEPPVEPETYHTNRVGVGEMLQVPPRWLILFSLTFRQEHGWTKLSDDKAPAAFAMWDTFNGTAQVLHTPDRIVHQHNLWQRYAKVLDLPRPSVSDARPETERQQETVRDRQIARDRHPTETESERQTKPGSYRQIDCER